MKTIVILGLCACLVHAQDPPAPLMPSLPGVKAPVLGGGKFSLSAKSASMNAAEAKAWVDEFGSPLHAGQMRNAVEVTLRNGNPDDSTAVVQVLWMDGGKGGKMESVPVMTVFEVRLMSGEERRIKVPPAPARNERGYQMPNGNGEIKNPAWVVRLVEPEKGTIKTSVASRPPLIKAAELIPAPVLSGYDPYAEPGKK